jgi:two-component system, NarL family, response regulator LiaR
MPRETIVAALAAGAGGYLAKSLKAKEIVDALEAIRDGEIVVLTNSLVAEPEGGWGVGWPGEEEGLTPRESEVLAFITQGLSNQEIAANLYLSINSVKSYIRTAYRKLGVASRSQAVRWGMEHGFHPGSMRRVEPSVTRTAV